MGFSKPKAIAAPVAPPPVTTTGPEVEAAKEAERLRQQRRHGYDWTMHPGWGGGKKTLLASVPTGQREEAKKRVLG